MVGIGFLIAQSVSCALNSYSDWFQSCNIRQPLVTISYQKTQLDSVSPLNYKWDKFQTAISFNTNSRKSNKPVSATGGVDVGNDCMEKGKDALTYAMQASFPHVHPHLQDLLVPFAGTVLFWFMVPRILQTCHKQGHFKLLSGSLQVFHEKSFWASLEDPLRYLMAFMAFAKIGTIVTPTTIASQYIAQAWRIAVMVSTMWFLYRWKTNELSSAWTSQSLPRNDRQEVLILDKVLLAALIVIGLMALSLACDAAIHSILCAGGIGGVAVSLTVRDIFKDVMGGLSMQLSDPFSVGDHIKIGSVEGQVVKMGLTMTSIMNGEEFPVLVPNSVFFDEGIVNQSRALCHPVTFTIPIQVDSLDKIPSISNEIKSMLRSNSKVFLGKTAPDCYLSGLECSFAELTLSYSLRNMNKDELYLIKEDILRQSVRIIKEHGVLLES